MQIDVRVDNREVSYWEVFNEVPELDFSYYYRPPTSECDEDVACCLKAHYVNFTEIAPHTTSHLCFVNHRCVPLVPFIQSLFSTCLAQITPGREH
uniref:CX domain-containing protein n=1 Tax=Heterorhabditis bacteriophora TaxID=37862 RepID=A0A1I7XHG8_HETBA